MKLLPLMFTGIFSILRFDSYILIKPHEQLKFFFFVSPSIRSVASDKIKHFLGQPITIIRTIGRFAVIFYKSCITKMVHSLFTKCLSTVFSICDIVVVFVKASTS